MRPSEQPIRERDVVQRPPDHVGVEPRLVEDLGAAAAGRPQREQVRDS